MSSPANIILGNLGSFWARNVSDSGTARSVLSSTLEQFEQIVLDAAEAVSVVSRFEVPIYKTELWRKVEVRVSEITYGEEAYKYVGEVSFNGQILFGQAKAFSGFQVQVNADGSLKNVGGVVNRPVDPLVSLVAGTDYTYSDGYLIFAENPENLGFTKSSIYNPETGEDEPTLIFWLYNSSVDFNRVYNHFGFVVDLYVKESSENYRTLVNAVFNTLIRGSNLNSFTTAAASIFNIPVVRNDGEVVAAVSTNVFDYTLQVQTDKNSYNFPANSTASVAVGDTVYGGGSLINEFQVIEGDRLLTFNPDGFGVELHGTDYSGPLIFENADVTLVTVATDTKVRVEFSIGGSPADVDLFWSKVRAKEDASGVSLANMLSLDDITGEPLPNQLPATVNPAKLVIREILRDNLVILKADQAVRSTITNTEFIPRLRELLHPHTMLLFQLSAGDLVDTKTVTATGPVDPDPEVNASTNAITLGVPDGTSDNYSLSLITTYAEISLVN